MTYVTQEVTSLAWCQYNNSQQDTNLSCSSDMWHLLWRVL